ncbi:hypothetical protein H8790_11920 [Oscillibacter hominis]|uniref:Uncharacterized protein n=1 Tax=Oscillibacter hominis TaxID=2763056 RepID=A0A7G9B3J9_9FIRM|nr:hypothetical protein [Oscillibacter hominis]QNL44130.1 hypothetical protein H8790_11920 [Oscillibacter hominis]
MKEKKIAAYSPAPGEFLLIPGSFRQEESIPHMLSYYGFSSFFTEAKIPDGGTEQNRFYRVVRRTIQSVFDRCAFTVTVHDFTRGAVHAWNNQLLQLQMLASVQGGKITKDHTLNCNIYRFIFKEFCCEFFEKISKVVDVDCRYESIYVTYLGMELNACDASDRKKEGMRPSILFWIDEEHPVLSVQMDFAYPLEKLTNALDKACQWEGWKLIVRSTVENI